MENFTEEGNVKPPLLLIWLESPFLAGVALNWLWLDNIYVSTDQTTDTWKSVFCSLRDNSCPEKGLLYHEISEMLETEPWVFVMRSMCLIMEPQLLTAHCKIWEMVPFVIRPEYQLLLLWYGLHSILQCRIWFCTGCISIQTVSLYCVHSKHSVQQMQQMPKQIGYHLFSSSKNLHIQLSLQNIYPVHDIQDKN